MKIMANYSAQRQQQNFGMAKFTESALAHLEKEMGPEATKEVAKAIEGITTKQVPKGQNFFVNYNNLTSDMFWHQFSGHLSPEDEAAFGYAAVSKKELTQKDIIQAVTDISNDRVRPKRGPYKSEDNKIFYC